MHVKRRVTSVIAGITLTLTMGTSSASAIGGFVQEECGGSTTTCMRIEKTNLNPWGHDLQGLTVSIKGTSKAGRFDIWGPNFKSSSPTKTWGDGEFYKENGFKHSQKGDLWCARFWEMLPNGDLVDASGAVCVAA